MCSIIDNKSRAYPRTSVGDSKNTITMASSKEGGTVAAAAEQLGSISLGESAERKVEPETTEDDQNEASAKLCSACGKKSDALKKCIACKCVWYCDKKCQNKHWKEHKTECKLIKKELDQRGGKLDCGTELDVGPIGKLPPREECPICMHALPINENLQAYAACCGKSICCGCNFQHQMKSKKRATERATCAFCREPMPRSNEEILVRLSKRAELKDPNALCNLAMKYGRGWNGLSVDQARCIELLRQSAGLGYNPAQYQLGAFHKCGEFGLEQNEEEALKYWMKAAEDGDVESQFHLGCTAYENSDHVAAMHHLRLSASGGLRSSMNNLIVYFQDGLLHHGDLAETLKAMYRSRAELKSEVRDQYIKHLKETGKYDDSMDWYS